MEVHFIIFLLKLESQRKILLTSIICNIISHNHTHLNTAMFVKLLNDEGEPNDYLPLISTGIYFTHKSVHSIPYLC